MQNNKKYFSNEPRQDNGNKKQNDGTVTSTLKGSAGSSKDTQGDAVKVCNLQSKDG